LKKIFFLLLATLLSAKYTNCNFKNKHYEEICKKVVKHGVSYDYANRFLLSYFKTQKYDEISWKYLQPSKIKYHQANERKANNILIGYEDQMVRNLKKYKKVYDKAEKKYGVNREIVSAILLKETKLGKIKPTHDAFIVFNTIVTRVDIKTSRDKWLLNMGKTNMVSIIEYCYKKKLSPYMCKLPSSYAGAVGIPQFMPNSFVFTEGYKKSLADLNKMEDAIMSVAKFLHKKAKFTKPIDWKKMPKIPQIEQEWYEFAYKHRNASLVYESKNKKYFTKNRDKLKYFAKYIKKILKYNNSSNYAIGVLRLAYDVSHFL